MTAKERIIEMIECADGEEMEVIQDTIITYLTLTGEEREALLLLHR